jgi:hypothetical protein
MPQPEFFDLNGRHEHLTRLGDLLVHIDPVVDGEASAVSTYGPSPTRAQIEYRIRDRYSFSRGLLPEDGLPDATTVWLFSQGAGEAQRGRRAVPSL